MGRNGVPLDDGSAAAAWADHDRRQQIPSGLLEAATSARCGGDAMISFAPPGGYIGGGLGHELLQKAHNLPAACRQIVEKHPDELYLLYFDPAISGTNAITLLNALIEQFEIAENVYNALFLKQKQNDEIDDIFVVDHDDHFIYNLRVECSKQIVFLFECTKYLKDNFMINRLKSKYNFCLSYLNNLGINLDSTRKRADLATLLNKDAFYVVEAAPIITAKSQDILSVFAQEGVDVSGRVIVHVPGELPYIRPSGWMSDGRTAWRPGEGEFPFAASHQGDPSTLRSRGRIFRRHLGDFIEGSVAEETDYVLTASAAICAFIFHGWPQIEGLSDRGHNPFARGPAAPIGQRHSRGRALPSDITGIDIEDLVGRWTFAGALRSYVTSRGKPPRPGTSFRDLSLSALSLAVTHQDFADNDVLRAARRRLVGLLGPRVALAPEVLRLCGFKVDPLSGQPLDATKRSDPALVLKLLEEDRQHLIRLRMWDRGVATRGNDSLDLRRIDHALKMIERDCVRPRAGPAFGDRLRADLKDSLARHEASMQAKGAELIYVAKGDEGFHSAELVRAPYRLGWLPKGLLAFPDDVSPAEFDQAARVAARVLGFEPFIDLPLNDRNSDDGDALLAVDDLAEDELLFSELAFHMGSREFCRRVSVLAANGVSDLVVPTWRKNDMRNGYAVDRFSPFNAGNGSPLMLPHGWPENIKHPDISKVPRQKSDRVRPDLAWTGWAARRELEVSVDELFAVAQAFYGQGTV